MTGPMHHDVPLDLGQRHAAVDQAPQELARGGDRRRTRWALIQRIRREIARGTYETPGKWEAVVSRLLALRVL